MRTVPFLRTHENRLRLLAVLTVAFVCLVLFREPIPQDPAYHDFADQRTHAGIPHAFNVLSNLPLALAGIYGLLAISRLLRADSSAFETRSESIPYAVLFVALSLTSFGSSYYHLAPDTSRLFWDRLPMSVAFMAYLGIAIVERIDRRSGLVAMVPLVAAGMLSVLYWRATELAGAGDLRYYVLVQAYPIFFVLLMVLLLPSSYTRGRMFVTVTALYLLTRLVEIGDNALYELGHVVSGHTLKHLFTAMAVYWIIRMLQRRRRCPREPAST